MLTVLYHWLLFLLFECLFSITKCGQLCHLSRNATMDINDNISGIIKIICINKSLKNVTVMSPTLVLFEYLIIKYYLLAILHNIIKKLTYQAVPHFKIQVDLDWHSSWKYHVKGNNWSWDTGHYSKTKWRQVQSWWSNRTKTCKVDC